MRALRPNPYRDDRGQVARTPRHATAWGRPRAGLAGRRAKPRWRWTKVHICFPRADFGKIALASTSVLRVGALHLRRRNPGVSGVSSLQPRGDMSQPTIHATPEVRPTTSDEPMLPETRERQCPSCHGPWIVHAGRVIGGGGEIRTEHRCELCTTRFWLVRKRIPLNAALAARLEDRGRRSKLVRHREAGCDHPRSPPCSLSPWPASCRGARPRRPSRTPSARHGPSVMQSARRVSTPWRRICRWGVRYGRPLMTRGSRELRRAAPGIGAGARAGTTRPSGGWRPRAGGHAPGPDHSRVAGGQCPPAPPGHPPGHRVRAGE